MGKGTHGGVWAAIQDELGPLREVAASIGHDGWKGGGWFVEFVQNSLRAYADDLVQSGGAEALKKRWPDMAPDDIADKLIAQAIRQATVAGLASGATASAAYAATLAPASLMAALPAALSALGAELLYTTRVQIRLVYDLATLYGYPLDLADPEDLYKAFALAYGVPVSVEEVDRDDLSLDTIKAHLRALTVEQGQTQRVLAFRILGPQIGRQVALRALARVGIPVVGIGASAALNFVATRDMALVSHHEIRMLARLRDAAHPLGDALRARPEASEVVLEALLLQATADGRFGPHEREIYDVVVQALGLDPGVMDRLEERVGLDVDRVAGALDRLDDAPLKERLATCLELVAISDGVLHGDEVKVALRFLDALGHGTTGEELRKRAQAYAPPRTTSARATRYLRQQAGDVVDKARPAVHAAGEKVGEAAEKVGEAAEKVGEAAERVGEAAGEAAEKAGHATVGFGKRAGVALGKAGRGVGHAAGSAATVVGGAAGTAGRAMGRAATAAAGKAGEAASAAWDWTGDVAEKAGERLGRWWRGEDEERKIPVRRG